MSYPLSGNLHADEGTIEMWLRLEDQPEGSGRNGLHHFPIFQVMCEGEKSARVGFYYTTVWSTNAFHFSIPCSGKMMGKLVGNPYITSVDESQTVVKGETGQFKYPRTPRLHKGDWHHLALTWKGANATTISLYLDGRQVILPFKTDSALWADVEGATLSFLSYPYHDNCTIDDFRISSVARTDKECAASFQKGALAADKYTLLLDRFEDVTATKETHPEVMAAQADGSRKGTILAGYVLSAEGKTGKGIRINAVK